MPRKAKEEIVENEVIDEKKKSVKKTASKKATTKKTDDETKNAVTKKTGDSTKKVKKAETKKEDDSTKKAKKTTTKKAKEEKVEEAPKKVKTTKKTTVKKAESKPAKTKTTTAKKKEASVKTKSTTKKKASPAKAKSIEVKEDNTTSKTKPATTKKKTATKAKSSATKKAATSTKATKSSKTTSAKKTTTRKKSTKTTEPAPFIVEYYDLPLKYGDTIVKLLAQTPKTLFVYWEVSDSDIANFKKEYGEDFFNKTKPFLIVHNITLNKTTEIEINDFANCWYLNTDDTDCKFDIELVRKFIDNTPSTNTDDQDYLYIAKSNDLNSPNNHILFEKIQEFVVFRNTTNDNVIKKNIKSFKFLKDIYKFYKDMYDEDILKNPSSQFKF